MGGDLTATSEGLGHGTTLTFSIPLCVPAASDPAAAAEMGGQSGDASTPGAAESWDSSSSSAAALLPLPPLCDEAQVAAAGTAAPQPSPAAPPPPSPPPAPSTLSPPSISPPAASPSSPVLPGAVNVLVAEDDALSQMVMRKLLAALRLRFTIVANGAAAVEAYKQGTRTHCTLPSVRHSLR
jgi:CheY-like chemotaxis protein